ncbi:MAG: hypothetical protein Q8M76_06840, partial [Spirochaetaceae bacterium]|nr:hypothetical protein [Spirochaetaceae bacterium]
MPDDIDPEIAALLGDMTDNSPSPGFSGSPDFADLFGDRTAAPGPSEESDELDVDLTRKGFAPVARYE